MPNEPQKVCMVTGGGSGIGLATAKRFAGQGWAISICGRRPEALETAANSIGDSATILATTCDVGIAESRKQFIANTLEKFGRIDVLVNNAGAAPLGDFESIDEGTFENVLSTNIRGVFHLSQAVWPILKSNGGGSIVNISSMAAVDPFPGFSIYGASKAWMEIFTKAIATEGTDHAIRACCVRPGAVETNLLRGLFPDYPAEQCVSPDDIASKVWDCVADPDNHPSGEAFTVSK